VFKSLLVALFCVAFLTKSGPAQGTADSLRRLDAEWARSYAENDTATAMKLFDDRIIVTSATGTLKDKNGEVGDVRPSAGLQMHFFRTRDVEIRLDGSAAAVAGLAEWSFTWNGRTNTLRRRYTATYARGGPLGWRMIALHLGPAPNPG
jgi:ketosteroid isomerase-like protein